MRPNEPFETGAVAATLRALFCAAQRWRYATKVRADELPEL